VAVFATAPTSLSLIRRERPLPARSAGGAIRCKCKTNVHFGLRPAVRRVWHEGPQWAGLVNDVDVQEGSIMS